MFVTKHRDVIMYIMYIKFSFFCFRERIDYFRFEVLAYFMLARCINYAVGPLYDSTIIPR